MLLITDEAVIADPANVDTDPAHAPFRVIPSVRVELELWRGGERPLGRALSQKAVVGISATSGSGRQSQSPDSGRPAIAELTTPFVLRPARSRRLPWRRSGIEA
jgi:hypothetical protein